MLVTEILQVENGPGITDCWWTDILPVENGPGWDIDDVPSTTILLGHFPDR